MANDSVHVFTGTGNTFIDAVQDLLVHVIAELITDCDALLESDRSIRITAEAETREALISAAVLELAGASRTFGQDVVSIQIDACRPIDRGFRIWARAGLSSKDQLDPMSVVIARQPVITNETGVTTIKVGVVITS